MLRINKTVSYYNNSKSEKNKQHIGSSDVSAGLYTTSSPVASTQVSFQGGARWKMNDVQRLNFCENFFAWSPARAKNRLIKAVEKMPLPESETVEATKKANEFFRRLRTVLRNNSKLNVEDATSDALGLALNDDRRQFVISDFKDAVRAVQGHPKYKKFLKTLSENLYSTKQPSESTTEKTRFPFANLDKTLEEASLSETAKIDAKVKKIAADSENLSEKFFKLNNNQIISMLDKLANDAPSVNEKAPQLVQDSTRFFKELSKSLKKCPEQDLIDALGDGFELPHLLELRNNANHKFNDLILALHKDEGCTKFLEQLNRRIDSAIDKKTSLDVPAVKVVKKYISMHEDFFNYFYELKNEHALPMIERAVEKLPVKEHQVEEFGVNKFFEELLTNLRTDSEKNVFDSIGETLYPISVNTNDHRRQFANVKFEAIISNISRVDGYENFLTELAANFTPVFHVETPKATEIKSQMFTNKATANVADLAVESLAAPRTSVQPVSEHGFNRKIKLSKSEKAEAKKDSATINVRKRTLKKQIKNAEKDLHHLVNERVGNIMGLKKKLLQESKASGMSFVKAEETRKANMSKIRWIMEKQINPYKDINYKRELELLGNKPAETSESFTAWAEKKQGLDVIKNKLKLMPVRLEQIKGLESEIAELNREFPNAQILDEQIGKAKQEFTDGIMDESSFNLLIKSLEDKKQKLGKEIEEFESKVLLSADETKLYGSLSSSENRIQTLKFDKAILSAPKNGLSKPHFPMNNVVEKQISDLRQTQKRLETQIREISHVEAENVKEEQLAKITRILNKYVKPYVGMDYDRELRELGDKPYGKGRAIKNWVLKKQKLEESKNRAQSIPITMLGVRKLRRKIAELNKAYPSIDFIAKKMEQVKRFLNVDEFNSKELAASKNEQKAENLFAVAAGQQSKRAESAVLRQENKKIEGYARYSKVEGNKVSHINIDYDPQIAEYHSQKAKLVAQIAEYRSQKSKLVAQKSASENGFTRQEAKAFSKSLNIWTDKLKILERKKALAGKFFQNEARIKEIELELKNKPKVSDSVLIAQKERINKYNQMNLKSEKLSSQITGKEYLELGLKKLEEQKDSLGISNQKVSKLKSQASQISDEILSLQGSSRSSGSEKKTRYGA